MAIRLQEGFLMNVLSILFRSGKVQGQPENRLIVLAHQHVKGRTRAFCASRISSASCSRAELFGVHPWF